MLKITSSHILFRQDIVLTNLLDEKDLNSLNWE